MSKTSLGGFVHFQGVVRGRQGVFAFGRLVLLAFEAPSGHFDPPHELFANVRLVDRDLSPHEIFVEPVQDLDEPVDRLELAVGDFSQREFEGGLEPGGLDEAMVVHIFVVAPHGLDDDLAHALMADRLVAGDLVIAEAGLDRRDDADAAGFAFGGRAEGAGFGHGGAIGAGYGALSIARNSEKRKNFARSRVSNCLKPQRRRGFERQPRGRREIDEGVERKFSELSAQQIIEAGTRDSEARSSSFLGQVPRLHMRDENAEQTALAFMFAASAGVSDSASKTSA